MISKDKMEKIKEFKNDDSDLICKIEKYLNQEYFYDSNENIYESADELKNYLENMTNNDKIAFFLFSNDESIFGEKINKISKTEFESIVDLSTIDSYYAGKRYELKLKKYNEIADKYNKFIEAKEKVIFIIDIASISSFPLWNTAMRRKLLSIEKNIETTLLEDLSPDRLHKIIKTSEPIKYTKEEKYDIDILINIMNEMSDKVPIEMYFIDKVKSSESIYLVNALKKFSHALALDKAKRYDYIYDTVCKDIDDMFLIYGFCNFKENKCISQRHKSLFNRYPVPKTDGCCFKVVRKCEHNNKDGTCKVKCLPCKLFTCPYLWKMSIGIRINELILLRCFFNNKQKKTSLYEFYNSKEFLLGKIISEE
ncbi:MAG: hypothetical protein IJX99_03835 [Clostridia bacterium]|nr:hypothetical protein [Clostridia bacterium]